MARHLRKILVIVYLVPMLLALILGGCGSKSTGTSQLLVKSTKIETIIEVEESSTTTTEYFLEDPENVFLTITLWVKPIVEDITISLQDMVLDNSLYGHFYPVGWGYTSELNYVFTSGIGQLEFSPENQAQVSLAYDFSYQENNSYGIENDRYRNYNFSGTNMYSTGGEPSFTLAYVIPLESINGARFQLELPDSQPIKLEIR